SAWMAAMCSSWIVCSASERAPSDEGASNNGPPSNMETRGTERKWETSKENDIFSSSLCLRASVFDSSPLGLYRDSRVIPGLSSSGLQQLVDRFRQVFVEARDVRAQFLFKLRHRVLGSVLQKLFQPRPADDDQGCSVLLQRVPDLLQIRTRQSSPKVPNQGSRTGADRELPHQVRREEYAHQRPHHQASPCPVLGRL